MLRKLFYYDIKWINRFMVPFMILTLFTSIFSRIFYELRHLHFLFSILYWTTMILANTLIINLIFNVLIRIILRFKSQLYGNESYLIHTLPVERKTVVDSKILSGIFCMLAVFLVAFICIFIEYYTYDRYLLIEQFIMNVSHQYQISVGILILLFILYLVFLLTWMLIMIFTAIELGFRHNDKKVIMSFVNAVILYIITQCINLIGIGIFSFFYPGMKEVFMNNYLPVSLLQPLFTTFVVLNFIYTIVYFILCRKVIQKKLNVD